MPASTPHKAGDLPFPLWILFHNAYRYGSPRLGPVAQWGLDLQRRQLRVDAAHFETSVPGIFAVGDGVSYPGKKKLILCGFHEATLATFAALRRLRPDEAALLQYTTTSALLQQRLGLGADRRPGIDAPPAGPVA